MPTRRSNRARPAPPTTDKGPRLGIAGSVALHAAILVAAVVTWNHSLNKLGEQTPVVPVDLVTITHKTNIAPMHIQLPPKEAVTPPALTLAAAPAPPQVKPPDIEIAPDTKPVKPEKTQEKSKAPDKEKPDTKKTLQQDFSSLLNTLTRPQKGKRGTRDIQGAGAQDAMTADLADALTGQIYKCWNPPTGVPHAEEMVVTVRLSLNPDGSVAEPPQSSADFGGPYRKAATEAAERAIYACAPYKLPVNRYSEWRQSTVIFNPHNLAG